MNPLRKKYRNKRENWRDTMHLPMSRIGLNVDRHLIDHAFLRAIYSNLHSIDSVAYRCSQPSPRFIKKLKQKGFKTIINLRGTSSTAAVAMEAEACKKLGIRLFSIRLSSRRLPLVTEIEHFKEILSDIEAPFVIHCKSGADRAGLASALYLLLVKKTSVAEAKEQFSLKYFHLAHSKTGVLGYFFDCYDEFNQQTPIDFMDWVRNHYDPKALANGFKPSGFSSWLVDKVLHRE